MHRAALLASLLLSSACPEPAAPAPATAPTPTAATPTAPAKECGPAWADAHRQRYAGICVEPELFDVATLAPVDWDLPQVSLPDGMPLRITAAGVAIGGDPEPFDEDRFRARLREEIDTSKAMAEAKGEQWSKRVMLAIDRDAKMALVDPAVRVAIAEQQDQAVLVLASANRRTPPAVHPELYDAQRATLENVPATELALHVARKLEPLAAKCEPVREVFRAIAMVSPMERCPMMTRDLADAFVKCGCPEVEAEIMTWVQVLGGPVDTPILLAQPVRLVTENGLVRSHSTWAEFLQAQPTALTELRVPAEP